MSADSEDAKMVRIELLISRLLLVGVWASLVLLAVGTLLCFVRSGDYGSGGGSPVDLHRLIAGPRFIPPSPGSVIRGWFRLDGAALIVTGLVLLIATPVLRVAVSIGAFAAVRDRRYVIITSVVFALLLLSFALGKAG